MVEAAVNRVDVIQGIIDRIRARTYLEIGVSQGDTFFPIKARKKIAVDPHFVFPARLRRRWIVKNLSNLRARYYESTSDEFFARISKNDHLDVVFVDGLHTHEQSLRDVLNSLSHLSEKGIIVLHDCNPPHEAAAHPGASIDYVAGLKLPGWTGEWCGDVWKTICYLRSHRRDLRVFVLDCDFGIGVVMKGEPDTDLDLGDDVLAKMTYADLANERRELLGLRDESYLAEFLEGLPR
jgi:hypothetical protein